MHVLVLCEYAALNGAERSLLAVIPHLRRGVQLTVAAPADGPLPEALKQLEVPHVAYQVATGTTLDDRRLHLERIINGIGPDLLHANSLSMSRLSGPVAMQLKLPSVGHLRDIVRLSAAAVRDINCHQRLLAVSQATRQWHVQQGLTSAKIRVLYNGVELERFRPRAARGWLHRELHLPRQALLVGAIGQLGSRKGQDVLLDAAQLIASQVPAAHYLLVGERCSSKDEAVRFEQALRRQADVQPLVGRVHFLGVRDDVPELLNELSLLVHAARQDPLPRVLLEAIASGTLVVASDVGGVREIVPPETASECLVDADDAGALAAAIERLLDRTQPRERMMEAARQHAVRRFDARRRARSLHQHYRAVAERKDCLSGESEAAHF